MEKYLATRARKTAVCPIQKKWCVTACQRCDDCKREERGWDECWSACDECNRCYARTVREDVYDEPYNYMPWWDNRKLSETPLAKQFCSNVCGVNMCKAFRQQYDGYAQCKRCQQQGLCWSQYQGRCIDCPRSQRFKSCEQKWGCPNPNGAQFGYVPPRDPMFSDCKPCWNSLLYTT
jgi:hypothetical protein